MSPELESIFRPIAATFEAQNLHLTELLDVLGSFAQQSPEIAHAMALHGRDYLKDKDNTDSAPYTYSQVIAEINRRTFFDPEYTPKYGTQSVFPTIEALQAFAEYLSVSFAMDATQREHDSMHEMPAGRQ